VTPATTAEGARAVTLDSSVDLDPALSAQLTTPERKAAAIHVLRARAEALRGPHRGDRALLLALRASELESRLLTEVGIEQGARVMREMATHPATEAAVERWLYAQELARRLLSEQALGAPEGDGPAG
jgi:hypothetical protein